VFKLWMRVQRGKS